MPDPREAPQPIYPFLCGHMENYHYTLSLCMTAFCSCLRYTADTRDRPPYIRRVCNALFNV